MKGGVWKEREGRGMEGRERGENGGKERER